MMVLSLGIGAFIFFLAAQKICWKVFISAGSNLVLGVLLLSVQVILLSASAVLNLEFSEIVLTSLLFASSASCYLIIFTGLEETSPSLAIIKALKQSGSSGCSLSILRQALGGETVFDSRLKSLATIGLIKIQDEKIEKTDRGFWYMKWLGRMEKLLKTKCEALQA